MKDIYTWITPEVSTIERYNCLNTMNQHRGNKPSVVRLLARDPMLYNQLLPFAMDIRGIRQDRKCSSNPRKIHRGSCYRHSETVHFRRPCRSNPQLDNVLGHEDEFLFLVKDSNCLGGILVHGMTPLKNAH